MITNEIKAKVISQYFGQICITPTRKAQGPGLPFKFLKGVLKEIDLGMQDSFIGLLLEDETIITNHVNYTPDECKLILKPLSAITDEEFEKCWKTISRSHDCLSKEWFKYHCKNATPENKKQIRQNIDLPAAQYLISLGYDLPQYLLDGKTLQESGLAIYED